MKTKTAIFLFSLLLILIGPSPLWGQEDTARTSGAVEILSMRKGIKELKDSKSMDYYYGDVVMKHDQVYIYCDSGFVEGKKVKAWGNVVIRQGDSLNTFGDRLDYDGETKIAHLEKNVVLDNRGQRLFTQKLTYDVHTRVATYFSGATLTDGKTFLKSKRGTYHVKTSDAFFKDSVIVSDPEFKMKTESLRYNTEIKTAYFLEPTLITHENSKIYTEGGYYQVEERFAKFDKNPQYLSDSIKSRAEQIIYDGTLKEIQLVGDAVYQEGDRRANADVMMFFEKTDHVVLNGNAVFIEGERRVEGDQLTYDRKNKKFKSDKRTKISDGSQILEADIVDFEDISGLGIARGKVSWEDTTENIRIFSEAIDYNKKEDFVKASGGRPLLVIEIDGDQLFISGDTLITYKRALNEAVVDLSAISDSLVTADSLNTTDSLAIRDSVLVDSVALVTPIPDPKMSSEDKKVDEMPEHPDDDLSEVVRDSMDMLEEGAATTPDSVKYMIVYGNVKIYKKDFRGVCDSLVYHSVDSIFTLFRDPMMWSDSTQFKSDTMQIFLKDGKMDRIDLLDNALIISTPNEVYYDQIKGRLVNAWFEEGAIDRIKVTGNAQTIYYVTDDDDAYTGVNHKLCSSLQLFFEEKKLSKIRFYNKPEGKFMPMGSTDHEALRLDGFVWNWVLRPESHQVLTDQEWIPWDELIKKEPEQSDQDEDIEGEVESEGDADESEGMKKRR